MNLFFTPNIEGDIAHLPEVEARHVVQVLRKRVGDPLTLIDGQGGWYEGEILETAKKRCSVQILQRKMEWGKRDFSLHIAIAPTKNIDRLEWFLEKSTEIGISEITPILCKNSERKRIREDRLEKIIISAMKQSLKAYLPKLNPLTKLADFLKKEQEGQLFIAHCEDDAEKTLLQSNYAKGNNVTILIGPEGDFAPSEIEAALAANFQPVSLGESRLRTETAGIVACHTVNLLNA